MSDKTIQFRLSGAPYLSELLKQQAKAYEREGHRHSPSKMARDLAEAVARHILTGEYVSPGSLRGVRAIQLETPSVKEEAPDKEEPVVPRTKRRAEATRFLK